MSERTSLLTYIYLYIPYKEVSCHKSTDDRGRFMSGSRNVLYVWNGRTFRSVIDLKRAYMALPFISTLSEMGYGMRPM